MPDYNIYCFPVSSQSGCQRYSVLHAIESFDAEMDIHDTDGTSNYFSLTLSYYIWDMYKNADGSHAIVAGSVIRVSQDAVNMSDTEEVGGVVDAITIDTNDETVLVEGKTWRGFTVTRSNPYQERGQRLRH